MRKSGSYYTGNFSLQNENPNEIERKIYVQTTCRGTNSDFHATEQDQNHFNSCYHYATIKMCVSHEASYIIH